MRFSAHYATLLMLMPDIFDAIYYARCHDAIITTYLRFSPHAAAAIATFRRCHAIACFSAAADAFSLITPRAAF